MPIGASQIDELKAQAVRFRRRFRLLVIALVVVIVLAVVGPVATYLIVKRTALLDGQHGEVMPLGQDRASGDSEEPKKVGDAKTLKTTASQEEHEGSRAKHPDERATPNVDEMPKKPHTSQGSRDAPRTGGSGEPVRPNRPGSQKKQ